LEDDLFGYLVDYLEGKELNDLRAKICPFKMSSSFLRILYSGSHVLDGGTNMTFLDFGNNIMQGV